MKWNDKMTRNDNVDKFNVQELNERLLWSQKTKESRKCECEVMFLDVFTLKYTDVDLVQCIVS